MNHFYRFLFILLSSVSILLFWLLIIANYQDFLLGTIQQLIFYLSIISYLGFSVGIVYLILSFQHALSINWNFFFNVLIIILNLIFYLYTRTLVVLTLPYGVT